MRELIGCHGYRHPLLRGTELMNEMNETGGGDLRSVETSGGEWGKHRFCGFCGDRGRWASGARESVSVSVINRVAGSESADLTSFEGCFPES